MSADIGRHPFVPFPPGTPARPGRCADCYLPREHAIHTMPFTYPPGEMHDKYDTQ
jgi:hypothetical protein